jgi:hypothetical protein
MSGRDGLRLALLATAAATWHSWGHLGMRDVLLKLPWTLLVCAGLWLASWSAAAGRS